MATNQINEIAGRIADDLFCVGRHNEAECLALKKNRYAVDGGGWSREALAHRVELELSKSLGGEGHEVYGFEHTFSHMQRNVHETARAKGWWDSERVDGELIALMHSELSEALEALRHGNPADDKIPAFSGVEAELADTVIRIMDYAEARGLRLAQAILAKAEMNRGRERMHGGKKF